MGDRIQEKILQLEQPLQHSLIQQLWNYNQNVLTFYKVHVPDVIATL
jgi:hypothetical protein